MNKHPNESLQTSGVSEVQTLWQSLYAKGAVNTPELPESQDMPWYIALMQAGAAWIAAWFL